MIEKFVLEVAIWLDGIHSAWIYGAIFFICFIENIFFPFPGDVLLVFSAIYVQQGRIELFPAYLVSVTGAALGYFCFYGILRWSSTILDRPFFRKFFPIEEQLRVERLFNKHGNWLIAMNRFVTGIRSMVAVVAAIAKYNPIKFILFTTISSALYNIVLFFIGYLIGDSLKTIDQMVHEAARLLKIFGWFPVTLTTGVIIFITIYIYRMYRKKKAKS
ncbi:MAG: DedA family protein [bacterium]|nr:DedA family protein [bacterium]